LTTSPARPAVTATLPPSGVMQLMHAYGSISDNSSNSAASSLLSVSA